MSRKVLCSTSYLIVKCIWEYLICHSQAKFKGLIVRLSDWLWSFSQLAEKYSWLLSVPGICLQGLPSNWIFVVAGCIHFLDAPPSQHSPTNIPVAFAPLLSYWVSAARPHRSKSTVMIQSQMNKRSTCDQRKMVQCWRRLPGMVATVSIRSWVTPFTQWPS